MKNFQLRTRVQMSIVSHQALGSFKAGVWLQPPTVCSASDLDLTVILRQRHAEEWAAAFRRNSDTSFEGPYSCSWLLLRSEQLQFGMVTCVQEKLKSDYIVRCFCKTASEANHHLSESCTNPFS